MTFFRLITVCFLAGLGYHVHAQDTAAINYMRAHAVRIHIDPDSTNFKDLSPLKTILNGKRIIGMGEATHGTHEFFAMKHRMLEFLVKEMGYRIFAIEANFTECRAVNNYVLYGKGDARKVIAGMYFWTWNTAEVLKMVEWMKDYNTGKPDSSKVKFYGFDMQFDKVASKSVAAKLKKLDSIYYYKNFVALDTLKIYRSNAYNAFSKDQLAGIKALLNNVKAYITQQHAGLTGLFGKEATAYLNRDLRLLEQCLKQAEEASNKRSKFNSANARDNSMAENIAWILNFEGQDSKMMLWAHNGHIDKIENHMGSYLKDQFKAQYYAIGFDFNKGGFRSVDMSEKKLKNFVLEDAAKGSTGNFFAQLGLPEFFIDIEGAIGANSTAKPFFANTKMPMRSIGSGYNIKNESRYYLKYNLYDQFDGLIFIDNVTAAIPL
jgi:erythromycin esterase